MILLNRKPHTPQTPEELEAYRVKTYKELITCLLYTSSADLFDIVYVWVELLFILILFFLALLGRFPFLK